MTAIDLVRHDTQPVLNHAGSPRGWKETVVLAQHTADRDVRPLLHRPWLLERLGRLALPLAERFPGELGIDIVEEGAMSLGSSCSSWR